jgi:hypothetical protein
MESRAQILMHVICKSAFAQHQKNFAQVEYFGAGKDANRSKTSESVTGDSLPALLSQDGVGTAPKRICFGSPKSRAPEAAGARVRL